MPSYLRLHVCLLLLTTMACGGQSPKMSVLGVKAPRIQRFDAPSVKVFVEVHNPTSNNLSLRRLKYRLVAKDLFDSRGEVAVQREIGAGASAVVEILVPVQEGASETRGVPYALSARLFAVSDRTERSWELRSEGTLANSQQGSLATRQRPQVASGR